MLLSACGGGGGGGGGSGGKPSDILKGKYYVRGLAPDLSPASTEYWVWEGTMMFDGTGGCIYTGTLEEGIVRADDVSPRTLTYKIGNPDSGSCTYNLSSNGTLTINEIGFTVPLKYAVSSDTNAIYNQFERMVKISDGSFDNASITGTYILNVQLYYPIDISTTIWPATTSMTFDGVDACTYEAVTQSGVISDNFVPHVITVQSSSIPSSTCTYSLSGDGILSIDGVPTYAVSADTNTLIGIRALSNYNAMETTLIRKNEDTGLTNASITGSYLSVGNSYQFSLSSTEMWFDMGVVTFDGAGNCNYTGTLEQGIVRADDQSPPVVSTINGTPDVSTCTYSVLSGGMIEINDGTFVFTYAMSADTFTFVGVNVFEDTANSTTGSYINYLVKTIN